MRKASKNERKGKKDKTNRKKDGKEIDKDIHLNVVGVPTTNVNVNKTAQKQQEKDYHLYKISIDTTRREREKQRKHHVSTVKPSQVQTKDNRARPNVTRSDTSSTESEYDRLPPSRHKSIVASESEPPFSKRTPTAREEQNEKIPSPKHTGNMGILNDKPSSSIAVKRKQSNDSNPDACFTTSEENKRKVRIVGSQRLPKNDSSKKKKPSLSKNSARKQVGFAELDAVYGTSPEESSQESDYDLPYKKPSPQVYQIQNMDTPDTFFKDPIKFDILPDSTESPKLDRNMLTRQQPARQSDLRIKDWHPEQQIPSIPREEQHTLKATDVPIERGKHFDSEITSQKADRKRIFNGQPKLMRFEPSPVSLKDPWNQASSPVFELNNSSPSHPFKDRQGMPSKLRDLYPSSERPSSIFSKPTKSNMSEYPSKIDDIREQSTTPYFTPKVSKIGQRSVPIVHLTSAKPQNLQEGVNPTRNNAEPSNIDELVRLPNKQYTVSDQYTKKETNIHYKSNMSPKLQSLNSSSQQIPKYPSENLKDNVEYLLASPYNVEDEQHQDVPSATAKPIKEQHMIPPPEKITMPQNFLLQEGLHQVNKVITPTSSRSQNIRLSRVEVPNSEDRLPLENYPLFESSRYKNEKDPYKLNALEYPRLQNAQSKISQEPSVLTSGYQALNRDVMSAIEKGTDTSDLYGPTHNQQIGQNVLPPARTPGNMSATKSHIKPIQALFLEDKTSRFDTSNPSISLKKEDEAKETLSGNPNRSDKKPSTVDRELMTEMIPDTVKESGLRVAKKSSRLLYPKRPSKESSKYKVEREKTSLRKYQNPSSIISTIPKPSFRERKSAILSKTRDQTEGVLHKIDEPSEVKKKSLSLHKSSAEERQPGLEHATSLAGKPSPLIKSTVSPANKMLRTDSRLNAFPIWSASFGENRDHTKNTKTLSSEPYSNLVDTVPAKVVDPSISHTYQESRLPIKPSDDTSIEISHRTYGDRSSIGTSEGYKVSPRTSIKISHDRPVNELITSTTLEGVNNENMPSYFDNFDIDGIYSGAAPVDEGFDSSTLKKIKEGRSPSYYNRLSSFLGKIGTKQNIQMNVNSSHFQGDLSKSSLRGKESDRTEGQLKTRRRSIPVIETIQEEGPVVETEQPPRSRNTELFDSAKKSRESNNLPENITDKNTAKRMMTQPPPKIHESDQGSSEYLKEPYKFERDDNKFNNPEILAYRGHVVDQNPFGFNDYSKDGPNQEYEKVEDLRDMQPNSEPLIDHVYNEDEIHRPPHINEHVHLDPNADMFEQPIRQSKIVQRDQTRPAGSSISNTKYPRTINKTSKNDQRSHTDNISQLPGGMNKSKINEESYPSRVKGKKRRISSLATNNKDPYSNKGKSKGEKSTEQTDIFGRTPRVEAVYIGKIPNTTLNVFFSPDATNMQTTDLINEDGYSENSQQLPQATSAKLITEGPKGILIFVNKKTDTAQNPFEDSHRVTGSSTPDSDKHKSPSDRRSSPVRRSESSNTSRKHHKTVTKSPSESKITETYPCGCVRIITKDSNGELVAEELISAFCRDGSKCEVKHPELQKSHRIISLDQSSKRSTLPHEDLRKYSTEKRAFPEIEVVADGVVSRKPIKPKAPSLTMKGANYTGTLNIKSDKFNGVCNFYIDERLKDYIRDNLDGIKAFLETKHEIKRLME